MRFRTTIFLFIFLFCCFFNRAKAQVLMCPGSTLAVIHAPIGFMTYSWTPPLTNTFTPAQLTLASLSVTNPVVGSVFTLQATSWSSVIIQYTYAITPSTLNIFAIVSSPSCSNGASGSASVGANGVPGVISYVWLNTTNSVVGTGSVASNLAPGLYSVIATTNPPCGTSTATVLVGATIGNQFFNIYKPYCNNEAYLCGGAGTNFQWYNNTVAIAPPLGTAQCYTVNNAVNGSIFYLKYFSSQGCHDSIKFTLGLSAPGNLGITSSTYACQGSANGSVVISMTPALGSPPGQSTFSVFSTGIPNPNYSASLAPGFQNTFNLINLSAGSYSVSAFDGNCKYTNSFVIVNFPDNFTLSPSSATLCAGQAIAAGISFTSPPSPSQYSYSWSPTTWLPGNNGSLQQTIIVPTVSPGAVTTINYSVTVTPSLINCPRTKTLNITAAHLLNPQVVPIPSLCANNAQYTINTSPSGGNFTVSGVNNTIPVINTLGVLTPSLATSGINHFTYAISVGFCMASSSSSFFIGGPHLNVIPSTSICIGNSATLSASGTGSFTWTNIGTGSVVTVSPNVNSVYTVSATHSLDACISSKTTEVIVLPLPTIQISGITHPCVNQNSTLSASGANSYTWSTGSTGNTLALIALSSAVYTVTGSDAYNCINTQTVLLSVNPGPNLQVSGSQQVCEGALMTLVASGASSYTWNASTFTWTNSLNTSTLSVIQSGLNTYTVMASTPGNMCNAYAYYTVLTVPCLTIEESLPQPGTVALYPNPTNGNYYLLVDKAAYLRVFDGQGKIVFVAELTAGKHSFDVSEYYPGIFLLEISSNALVEKLKLIKQ